MSLQQYVTKNNIFTFQKKNSYILVKSRIRIDLKCRIRIQLLTIEINADPKHWSAFSILHR